MDRNTIIGLVLIGTILTVFTIWNRPSQEEIEQQRKEQVAQKAEKEKLEASLKKDTADVQVSSNPIDSTTVAPIDTTASASQASTTSKPVEGEIIYLENAKYKIAFNTKGGMIDGVWLKEYESYKDYVKNDGKTTPLALFKEGDAKNQLVFPMGDKTIKTGNLLFKVKGKTDRAIVFATDLGNGKIIENHYTLKPDAYDLEYTVKMKGFGDAVNAKNVGLNWDVAFRKTERLFSEQRRVSTICMNYSEEGFDYLSEMASDDTEAEDDIEWVAYKQSYFSSILQPEKPFVQKGSEMEVSAYKEGDDRMWTHLKDYSSTFNLGLSNTSDASVSMTWFFGPNDYNVLSSYDQDYDDILNLGWGIFRWINLYAVQPLFTFLTSSGVIGIGWAILLLTIILKFVLMPIQWKMYVSSAKMRILKPEIDELNTKYPNKEDGMKKQMEMMTLYRESGASPLAGCVPMLVQMPILLAVFRFFPTAFELRQKSFLWAEDLSSYDSIWDFGVNIWPYGDHVSLFTLLMAGTTLIYTVINSSNMQTPQQPGMPNMKVIMYIFPIMMIFFFNNYSSGLSYYYFISTLLSILIMLLIKQFFVDEEKLKLKMAERKASRAGDNGNGKAKKKSKFQERLEQMQKAQQEQLKNRRK